MATGRIPTTANSPLTAKGDLFTFSTGSAKLAVGNNGETLVADSAQSTGLRWGNNYGFTAGKNKFINGDFRINQRNFTSLTADAYGFDRWNFITNTGTTTYSAQTFTPGTAPVAGYEGINFARLLTSGQTGTGAYSILQQRVEDVRTLAGQTYTVSFWAKAASGTPKVAIQYEQVFGSGGSATVNTYAGQVTLSTSWARYSVTAAVPSISGKTVGTSSYTTVRFWVSAGTDFNDLTGSIGVQNNTFDFWGTQMEQGSVATAFQTATGTIQGELAACQRYFEMITGGGGVIGQAANTTTINIVAMYKVTKRVAPTLTGLLSVVAAFIPNGGSYTNSSGSAYTFGAGMAEGVNGVWAQITGFSGITQDKFAYINTTSNIISVDAEL
jgi:hypothetical protein